MPNFPFDSSQHFIWLLSAYESRLKAFLRPSLPGCLDCSSGDFSRVAPTTILPGRLHFRRPLSAIAAPAAAAPRHLLGAILLAAHLLCPGARAAEDSARPQGNQINPLIAIRIDQPILRQAEPPALTRARLAISTSQFPPNARLVYQWRQLQDELHPRSVRIDAKPVRFTAATAQQTDVIFPDAGVYTFSVLITDKVSRRTWRRNAWVNVWANRSASLIDGKPDPLLIVPGILPPSSVRQFSPDPGPFAHPRLLCTPADWPDLHGRCVEGKSKIASQAFKKLENGLKQWRDPKHAQDLQRYATDFAGAQKVDMAVMLGIKGDKPPGTEWGNKERQQIGDTLSVLVNGMKDAGLVQWLQIDPKAPWESIPAEEQAVCRRLARALAGFSNLYLAACWIPGTDQNPRGTFKTDFVAFPRNFDGDGCPGYEIWHQLALAYDFIYPWMTAAEQRATRNLLTAAGVGRFTWRTAGAKKNGVVTGGWQGVSGGGGTFSNFGEAVVTMGMVVAGEESGVSPEVVRAFLNPAAPDAEVPGDPKNLYPESLTWPNARKTDVNNLVRQNRAMTDGIISPWGFYTWGEEESYGLFWPLYIWPSTLPMIRQGAHNMFITGDNYQVVNQVLFSVYPYLPQSGGYQPVQHHSGNGDHRFIQTLMLKYIYPDDPATDFIYASRCESMPGRIPFETCLFGLDPKPEAAELTKLEEVAKAKGLPLTKIDPKRGRAVLRSGWNDEALFVDLDALPGRGGHSCGEANSFSLLALGRSWSLQGGYHKTISNWHAGISFQVPEWASDPTTKGFVGIHPFWKPEGVDVVSSWPTAAAQLLDWKESPDRLWSQVVGDAAACYSLIREKDGKEVRYPPTAVEYAFRSLILVRGKRPYVFIVDDIRKDDVPRNWRWFMNNPQNEGSAKTTPGNYSMVMAPGATATEAILLHKQDAGDRTGHPRLLVRELGAHKQAKDTAMFIDQTQFDGKKTGDSRYLNEQNNSLTIERQNVVEPGFKVLLFPFRTGESLPVTTWNAPGNELTINLGDGTVDILTFDRSNPDHRTRVKLKRKP